MSSENTITWKKESASGRIFGFQVSPKISGRLRRKGLWNPEGSAELGTRTLRFKAQGKANMDLKVYEGAADELVGTLKFYWKDFQNSRLELSSGNVFQFKALDLLRGAWTWVRLDGSLEQISFHVDTPLHRSGRLEVSGKDLSAQERDILILLGLNLQHYLNTWLMTFVILLFMIVSK